MAGAATTVLNLKIFIINNSIFFKFEIDNKIMIKIEIWHNNAVYFIRCKSPSGAKSVMYWKRVFS
jgi:hypothetical protein